MKNTRREFLKKSVLGTTLVSLGMLDGCTSRPHSIKDLGLITGVISRELKEDYKKTLTRVSEIGYKYLEFGNYMGPSPEEFKSFLNDLGIIPLAGGSSMAQMIQEDELKKMVDAALSLNKKYMVCYWPWMDDGNNKKLDDFKQAAERLNRLGEQCNQMGIRFAFHNHDKEFVPVQGYQWGCEVLLEETDPNLAVMELDLYWITKGGGDPLVLFDKYPGRFEIFHVKDMENTPEKLYTCPGYGIIDFASIFAQSKKAGVKYYVVEIDQYPEPMQCVEDSFQYLKSLKF